MSDAVKDARKFFVGWDFVCDSDKQQTIDTLAALLTEERTKALEEAARICDDHPLNSARAAKLIRALNPARGGEGTEDA